MKICAVICEYNPFHNGHLYQLNKAKELTGCDAVMCVMGGNFNQRGLPCIFDKYTKTEIALQNTADIIVEIPSAYCTQSAEIFALSSIKIINSFPNVTHICFGSECGNIEVLCDIAHYLCEPDNIFIQSLKENLNNGLAYSKCIEKSLINEEWKNIISLPNNLLAIEYLKAIKLTNSNITPITIKRTINYNDNTLNYEYASATAIRNAVENNECQKIKKFVPENTYRKLEDFNKINYSLINNICSYKLNIDNKNLDKIFENNEGISEYLKKSFLPTVRYKINKINRTKLNIILGIEKNLINKLYKAKKLPYIKLLGCKKTFLPYLKCNTKLIIRKNDIPNEKSKYFLQLEQIDNNSNYIYSMIQNSKLSFNSLYVPAKIK